MNLNPFKIILVVALCLLWVHNAGIPSILAEDKPDTQADTKESSLEEISKWISRLDSDSYQERKQAHQNLLFAGSESIPLLEKAAHKASHETCARILLIIEHHIQNNSEEFHEPATAALESFLDSENKSLILLTHPFWNQNVTLIELRAIEKLRTLNCSVKTNGTANTYGSRGLTPASRISQIVIHLNWKGGEEGLRYLGRLRTISELAPVYCIEGNGLDLKSFQKAESKAPNLKVQFRGPSLLGVECFTTNICQIRKVAPDSTADNAGLLSGDVITKFNGKPTPDFRALTDLIAETMPGDKIKITFKRNLREYEVSAAMLGWPQEDQESRQPGIRLKNRNINPNPKPATPPTKRKKTSSQ